MTRLLTTASVFAFAAVLASCAGPNPNTDYLKWSPEKIYQEARDAADNGATDKAADLFEKLEGRAAGTALAQQAQIEKAYMHYKAQETIEALATLDRFMRLHPASPAYEYALYLKGLVNFNDNLGIWGFFLTTKDMSERDSKALKDAYNNFKELSERFPQSIYALDAKQRMVYIQNALSQAEVNIARYYASKKSWLAAINRAQSTIVNYPGTPAQEEALGILSLAYEKLGEKQLLKDTQRILKMNYPQSRFLISSS